MARPDAPGAVLDAVHYLEVLAKAGVLPDAIATEATAMAVQPWFQGCGEPHPRGLVAMMAELRRWCADGRAGTGKGGGDGR